MRKSKTHLLLCWYGTTNFRFKLFLSEPIFFLMLRKIGGYGKNFIGQFLKKYNRAFNRILSSFVQYKQKNRPFAALVWHNKFCTISAHCAIEGAEEAMRIESQPSASAASLLSSIPIFSKPQQPQYTAFRCFSHRRKGTRWRRPTAAPKTSFWMKQPLVGRCSLHWATAAPPASAAARRRTTEAATVTARPNCKNPPKIK